jgi:hypothetical protein
MTDAPVIPTQGGPPGMSLAEAREHYGVREWGRNAPAMVRLLRKSTEDGDCWIWTGTRDRNGYGNICRPRERRMTLAHRLAYELFVGTIPSDREIDHLCRNRACLRPSHLEPVTRQQNMLRAVEARGQREACDRGHLYPSPPVMRAPDRNGKSYVLCRECRNISQQQRRAVVRGAAT